MNLRSNVFMVVIEEYDICNDRHITYKDIIDSIKDNEVFEFYALILHDKDINDNGELERKHFHLVVKLAGTYAKSTLINYFAKLLFIQKNCIGVKTCDLVAGVQYLDHRKEKNKYQYDYIDIYSNDYDSLLTMLDKGINYLELDIDYIIKLINESDTLTQVFRKLGLKHSKVYYTVINQIWKDKEKYRI